MDSQGHKYTLVATGKFGSNRKVQTKCIDMAHPTATPLANSLLSAVAQVQLLEANAKPGTAWCVVDAAQKIIVKGTTEEI
jgi:hypothetical protein